MKNRKIVGMTAWSVFVSVAVWGWAQLPPSLHRIAPVDSSVDWIVGENVAAWGGTAISQNGLAPDWLIAPRDMQTVPEKVVTFEEVVAQFHEKFGAAAVSDETIDWFFPTGGVEPTTAPGEKPSKNIPIRLCTREEFDARVNELGLIGVSADDFRDGVFAFWGEQYVELSKQISGEIPLPRGAAEQVFDPESLIAEGEKFPVEVVLRRIGPVQELLESFDTDGTMFSFQLERNLEPLSSDYWTLKMVVESELAADSPNTEQLATDYFLAAAVRRKMMFLNPLLVGNDSISFLTRGCYSGSRLTNMSNLDVLGGHFATQVFGFNSIPGGGLFVLSDWSAKEPVVTNLLADQKVVPTEICSRLAGEELTKGSFYAPEVSYDGKTLYFSHTSSQRHRWFWSAETTWNIFKLTLGSNGEPNVLTQLTDSAYNDFDVCELPSGDLVFASERRGGFIRCFAPPLRVTTSVLHHMKPNGADIYPISFFETSEWQPSVDHGGMLVYTRWDYTDRENCLGSTFWTCAPDGRNPRSPQGNYPQPWGTFEDNTHGDHRFGNCADAESALPMTEMQFRAIPDSHRYVFTAAPHHGETFGSLCMLDLRVPDDNQMSRIRRLTPYVPFPESESPGRSQYCYGSPWPLGEDLYFCNRWEDLILLDGFGNEELLCERELLPIGYDARVRLSEPIPLSPRAKPPVIPQQTTQGVDFVGVDRPATVGVINVNIADRTFPENRPAKRLRVVQVIPKPNPWMDTPGIGYATENTPRIPLGTVPIEPDGSVYFEAPPGKELLFQLLDEEDRAIQTMRAVTYLHPGEKLICIGCHEPQGASVGNEPAKNLPVAFTRAASKLTPECGAIEPMNFFRRVAPILERSCLPCHTEKGVAPNSFGYEDLRPYVYCFSGSMLGGTMMTGTAGGSRATPGRFGAAGSRLGEVLFDENHAGVSAEDRHVLILWLDVNAPRLGAFRDEAAQMRGELVWPILDCDDAPNNPSNR